VLAELSHFLGATLSGWLVLWTGLGAAILTLIEKARDRPMSFKSYVKYCGVLLPAFALATACHREYLRAEQLAAEVERHEKAHALELLSHDQIDAMRRILARVKGDVSIVVYARDKNARELGNQFAALFQQAGWSVGGGGGNVGTEVGEDEDHELRILADDFATPQVGAIQTAFHAGQLHYHGYRVNWGTTQVTLQIGERTE
jgi:hypothetical protein